MFLGRFVRRIAFFLSSLARFSTFSWQFYGQTKTCIYLGFPATRLTSVKNTETSASATKWNTRCIYSKGKEYLHNRTVTYRASSSFVPRTYLRGSKRLTPLSKGHQKFSKAEVLKIASFRKKLPFSMGKLGYISQPPCDINFSLQPWAVEQSVLVWMLGHLALQDSFTPVLLFESTWARNSIEPHHCWQRL